MSLLDTPKLGFGLMRLPTMPGEPDRIDIEQTKTMVDMFMEAGLTYFDTAFVYGKDGASEKAAKEALVDRYPRDSFTLATKINAFLMAANEEECKRQFRISLERTGAGYFDFYLLHAIQTNNYKKYDEYGIWDYVKGLKKEQINYADWENPSVTSRANYEVARKHGVPIVVMEPVKGGTLANPPMSVQEILKAADPGASLPSWAIRYVASLPGILTVLSGMSNIEQMKDNLSYMKPSAFKPLSKEEQEVIAKAQEALAAIPSIPCTGCNYCAPGCPMNIPIPDIFSARNKQMIFGMMERGQAEYDRSTAGKGKASDCIQCGQCEGACPQRINIIERLQECASVFE